MHMEDTAPQLTPAQRAKSRYYFKNRDAISSNNKNYYQQNKQQILHQRRERHVATRAQRTEDELVQILDSTAAGQKFLSLNYVLNTQES